MRVEDATTVKRSATVPLSLLRQEVGAGWSMPAWALEKKLKTNEQFADKPVWPGLAALLAQLQSAFDTAENAKKSLEQSQMQAAQAAHLRHLQDQAVRDQILVQQLSALRKLVEEDGEYALAFAKKRLTLADLAELGHTLSAWPRWLPGEPVAGSLVRQLASLVEAVRQHPDFVAWRAKNMGRKGHLLKAPRPPKPKAPQTVHAEH
jgi:hypothetical protein